MKLEFEDRDFEGHGLVMSTKEICAQLANAKLEKYIKEHGRVVYGCSKGTNLWNDNPRDVNMTGQIITFPFKAVIINIEPIQKCDHSKGKVCYIKNVVSSYFECECGAKVEPVSFRSVE